MTLVEIAEGIDLERDVLDRMGFRPKIAQPLGVIDPRVFRPGPMGLAASFGVGV
jgi:propionate CoA-transferase